MIDFSDPTIMLMNGNYGTVIAIVIGVWFITHGLWTRQ